MDIKKICAALCACVVCLCAAGCSKDSKDSSSATESKANVSTADNADSAKSEDSKGNESDADSKVVNEQGELITKTAAIFDGDYTLKTTCTEADGSKQEVVRAKKGGNIYLKVTSDIGTSGFIYVDGAGYDYDNVTGVYHKSDVTELDGVLESIVKQNLPRTYGHINSDEADDFDIEEYTYTGDTYITAIDLYFDKSDGSLKNTRRPLLLKAQMIQFQNTLLTSFRGTLTTACLTYLRRQVLWTLTVCQRIRGLAIVRVSSTKQALQQTISVQGDIRRTILRPYPMTTL